MPKSCNPLKYKDIAHLAWFGGVTIFVTILLSLREHFAYFLFKNRVLQKLSLLGEKMTKIVTFWSPTCSTLSYYLGSEDFRSAIGQISKVSVP